MLRAHIEDPYDWIVSYVCDGVPSEIDYVNEKWTHERIAVHYGMKVFRNHT